MIETRIIRQIVSYEPVAYELEKALLSIQNRGYKAVNVIETKVNRMQGTTDQGFIILYDTGADEESEE